CRAPEGQLVVLADYLHHVADLLGERGGGHEHPVGVGAALPAGGHGANHRHLVIAVPEEALHARLALTPSHEGPVGLVTEEQPQSSQEQGLAGPGLAGDHVETRSEVQGGVGDDTQVDDPQVMEHQPSRNLSRTTPVKPPGRSETNLRVRSPASMVRRSPSRNSPRLSLSTFTRTVRSDTTSISITVSSGSTRARSNKE